MQRLAKMIILIGLSISFMSLVGCGTMAGIGKDIKSAGQAIENGAQR
jgi:predicted small secreted protein